MTAGKTRLHGEPPAETDYVSGYAIDSKSKHISVTDEVYRQLKRDKGDRTLSEVFEDRLDAGRRLVEVTGLEILHDGAVGSAKRDVERLSGGTISQLDDEAR